MTAIELRFLANRYHGTAWGRHVNEGVGEWPPSPYRLLRALYDAWKRKCSELSEQDVMAVFQALAKQPPEVCAPKVVAAHTRSYLHKNTEEPTDKALVFDGFVSLPKDARCYMRWETDLSEQERRTLSMLLGGLNYLGRSESWLEARISDQAKGPVVWQPIADGFGGNNTVSIACAIPAEEYQHGKLGWMDALAFSSGMVVKQRISQPPALRFVAYQPSKEGITIWLPTQGQRRQDIRSAAILELSGKVLPKAQDTVRVAERIRGRLMRIFELNYEGQIPGMVHGKDDQRRPLKDHSHLFILPRSNRLGRIDHILVYTERAEGFVEKLDDAIAQIGSIHWMESIRCVASWMGRKDDAEVRPKALRAHSATPFVTVRHWRKGRDFGEFLKGEVELECKRRGLPVKEVKTVKPWKTAQFRRNREGEPSRPGYCAEIEFERPVETPFALGYGSHFGLGQFEKYPD